MEPTKALNSPYTDEERGVSPVIGVILMVAITVILAAVIASFVLAIDGQDTTPTADFDWDYDGTDLTVSMNTGKIVASDVQFRGSGFTAGGSGDLESDGTWPDSATSGSREGASAITAGDSVTFPAQPNYDIDLVYVPENSDSSATLDSDAGPDA